jgi:hypothetical protein
MLDGVAGGLIGSSCGLPGVVLHPRHLAHVLLLLGLVAWMFAAQSLKVHDLGLTSTGIESCTPDDGAPHAHPDSPHHCGLDDLQLSSRGNPELGLYSHFSRCLPQQEPPPRLAYTARPPLSYAPKQGPPA